ncbi:hypothetical protein Hanom_Chr08g00730691 [Helianthus anomalus]
MRIAVTSQRRVSLYGSVLMSWTRFPTSFLGRLRTCPHISFSTFKQIIPNIYIYAHTRTVLTVCSSERQSPRVSGMWE